LETNNLRAFARSHFDSLHGLGQVGFGKIAGAHLHQPYDHLFFAAGLGHGKNSLTISDWSR
jgi:hypothetical protein